MEESTGFQKGKANKTKDALAHKEKSLVGHIQSFKNLNMILTFQ